MTPLQRTIYQDLERHGPSTVHEIADRTGRTARAVSTSLTFMRGSGTASEVCTVTRHPDRIVADFGGDDRRIEYYSTTYPPGPVRWTLDVQLEHLHPQVLEIRHRELAGMQ